MRLVPWWGLVSSALAPVLLIGGWTVAAGVQPAAGASAAPRSRTSTSLAVQARIIVRGLLGFTGMRIVLS